MLNARTYEYISIEDTGKLSSSNDDSSQQAVTFQQLFDPVCTVIKRTFGQTFLCVPSLPSPLEHSRNPTAHHVPSVDTIMNTKRSLTFIRIGFISSMVYVNNADG